MRRGREGKILYGEDGAVIAVSLGADFTAEHEWGIDRIQGLLGIKGASRVDLQLTTMERLKEFFGLQKYDTGIEARTMTKAPSVVDNLGTKGVKDKHSGLTFYGIGIREHYYFDREVDWKTYVDWFNKDREELIGHWSGDRFLFMCPDKKVVQEFKDAFDRMDIAVWVGGSGPFQNGGLVIAIASRVPQGLRDDMAAVDLDRIALQKAAHATGIYQKLKGAGKSYYALSPRWKDEAKSGVKFWLNPQEQNIYNYGWYGVEELEQWAKGTGPIVKKAKTAKV